MVWALRGLCFIGLSVSGYLAWTAIRMVPVYGCGGGAVFDCGHVLSSRWSKVMDVPVSVPAVGLYASLLVMLGFVRSGTPAALKKYLWRGLTFGVMTAGLAALWFISLQLFALKHLCFWCLTVHSCGLLLAGTLLVNKILSSREKQIAAVFSGSAVAGMIVLQSFSPEPRTFEVIRHDQVSVNSVTATGDADTAYAPDAFAPPEEFFAAPGTDSEPEFFTAPETVDGRIRDDADVEKPSGKSAKDAKQPVAASLLLIMSRQIPWLLHFPVAATTQNADATADERAEGEKRQPTETEPTAVAAPERRLVTVGGNRVNLDVRHWPLLGKPDAKYVFVEMFDYTCPHCRNTHRAIQGAFEQFGDDLAILALPVPIDPSCNKETQGSGHSGACELAKIAVAVWRADPEKFREFHDWMFETAVTPALATTKARKLIGAEKFNKEFSSTLPSEYIRRHVQLYAKVGRGSVPKLLFPRTTINGEVSSKSVLCSTIERELGSADAK